jgi:hypothetical protein
MIEITLHGPKTNKRKFKSSMKVFELPSQVGKQTISSMSFAPPNLQDKYCSSEEDIIEPNTDSDEELPDIIQENGTQNVDDSESEEKEEPKVKNHISNMEDSIQEEEKHAAQDTLLDDYFVFPNNSQFALKTTGYKVLIIEDNSLESDMIKRFLQTIHVPSLQAFTLESVLFHSIF